MDAHVLLPGGYWAEDGALHRDAWLRPLTGHEEELLGSGQSDPARATTLVLSRCLLRLGPLEPVPAEVVRRLLVGDREALLLRLRQLTFGDLVRADLICPWPQCGEQVSLTFQLGDLPWPEPPVRAPTHTLRLSRADAAAGPVEVTFRLPDGGDQEELSSSAATHPAAALSELLRRCVVAVVPEDQGVAELTPASRAEIETEMERLAPQLDRCVQTRCAECDRLVLVPFDLHRCFFGELSTDADLLYREVHRLAYHYHWGESEILAMPRPRRHTYLGVLAEELESQDHG
jgi:hypothetical protein